MHSPAETVHSPHPRIIKIHDNSWQCQSRVGLFACSSATFSYGTQFPAARVNVRCAAGLFRRPDSRTGAELDRSGSFSGKIVHRHSLNLKGRSPAIDYQSCEAMTFSRRFRPCRKKSGVVSDPPRNDAVLISSRECRERWVNPEASSPSPPPPPPCPRT